MAPESPAHGYSARSAAETIQDLVGYEEPLRRRAEGVTWMVWGLVTLAVFLSMPAAEAMFGWPWLSVVLLAWIALGLGLSKGVWSVAATAAPRLRPTLVRTVMAAGVTLALWVALMFVGEVFWPSEEGGSPGGFGLVMLGTVWVVAGAFQVRPTTPLGRRVLLAVGALIAAVGAVLLIVGGRVAPEAWGVLVMGAPAGGIPFFAGLWQALRG